MKGGDVVEFPAGARICLAVYGMHQEEVDVKLPEGGEFHFSSTTDALYYFDSREIELAQRAVCEKSAYPPGSGMGVFTRQEELLWLLGWVPLKIFGGTEPQGINVFFYRFPDPQNPGIASFAIRVVSKWGHFEKVVAIGKLPRVSGDNSFEVDQEKRILSLVFENLVRLEIACSVGGGEELLQRNPAPPRAFSIAEMRNDSDLL